MDTHERVQARVLLLLQVGIGDDLAISIFDNPGIAVQVKGRRGPEGLHILQGDLLPAILGKIVQFYQVMHSLQVVHGWTP
jgi:hypothetical protein